MDAIIENSHKFVALPTPRQQKIIAEEIENEKHLPNALGYMDGVLCKIPKPKDSGTDFIDRKARPSLNSQFFVDSKYVIRDMVIGKCKRLHLVTVKCCLSLREYPF